MLTHSLKALVASLTMMVLVGCGAGSGQDLHGVTGKVTFDNEPVKEGRILFRAVDGDQRAFSGPIENGLYKLEARPGKMRVEITASRIVPGKFDTSNPGEKVPIGEMYIPARYNSKTELTAEVKPGSNTADFPLTGAKK
ncbi:MAG: hypothetical protein ABFD16_03750 [Thermoguttaceae bacterium]|jgi:hypothetical protein